jgi:uncharacterized RDD family membrane protein YckC
MEEFNFEFKPISKGLGFHHPPKKNPLKKLSLDKELVANQKVTGNLKSHKPLSLNNNDLTSQKLEYQRPPLQKSQLTLSDQTIHSSATSLAHSLKPKSFSSMSSNIYPQNETNQLPNLSYSMAVENLNLQIREDIAVPMPLRFLAFIVDFIIICLCLLFCMCLFAYAVTQTIEIRSWGHLWIEIKIYIWMVGAILYLVYFSLLDLTGSFGKILFNQRLVCANSLEQASFSKVLFRSLLSFISLHLFGLPIFLHWVDKLSHSRVIKKRI